MRCLMFSLLFVAASLQAASPNAAASVRIHGGTVMVRSSVHATILLVRNGNGDGAAEHLFQVWSNPGLEQSALYRGADVEYSGTSLIVIAPSEQIALTYNVAGYKAPAVPAPEGFSTTVYNVAGMNHQVGASVERLTITTGNPGGRLRTNECQDCGFLPFEDPWGAAGGGSGSCNSGGVGSTSCSVSGTGGSCSVTCGAGYACCKVGNPPSCTCVN